MLPRLCNYVPEAKKSRFRCYTPFIFSIQPCCRVIRRYCRVLDAIRLLDKSCPGQKRSDTSNNVMLKLHNIERNSWKETTDFDGFSFLEAFSTWYFTHRK